MVEERKRKRRSRGDEERGEYPREKTLREGKDLTRGAGLV